MAAHPDAPAEPAVAPVTSPTPLDPRAFKDLFRLHPSGVAVVTLSGPDGSPVGFTATSVISVSAAPAVLAFSITSISSSWPALREASSAVVSFLAHDQADLSVRFATPGIDRFADVALTTLPTGEPRLAEVTSWARVEILDRVPAGASFLITAAVTDVHDEATPAQADQPRLVYVDRTYHRTGEHSQVG
ncbi:flavin reductase family protein [Litorihabitans aurantiacus]|uniref:Flavin-dependent reductase n=1 Tax=Litorihabitans aurantiacus TaxID=1930061 RepID=A0AA37XBD8_9MICO|nr:flavin reductase family protein [Litorihabitans aurantiacus]GMA30869.1 flavin-dependent reductase [Litorihabitans aurantiacus]